MEEGLTKQYYKIADVAELLDVPKSTIRFWESEFPECNPTRSPGNKRMYTPADIETLRIIHYLLKVKGLKMEAAKEQLRTNRKNVSKRVEVIEKLTEIRNDLDNMLKALSKRAHANGDQSE